MDAGTLVAALIGLAALWTVVFAYLLASNSRIDVGRFSPLHLVASLLVRISAPDTLAGRLRRLPTGALTELATGRGFDESASRTAALVLFERDGGNLLHRASSHGDDRQKHERIAALRILAASRAVVAREVLERAARDADHDVAATAAGLLSAAARAPVVVSSRRYVSVRTRFWISIASAGIWAGYSIWISSGWIGALARPLNELLAIIIIAGIAIIPGYLNLQLLTSLLLDRPKPLRFDRDFPKAALVIAAYNEEEMIRRTLSYACAQSYDGALEIIVADDGSTDGTAAIVEEIAATDPRVRLLRCTHRGKAHALNAGLESTDAVLLATIDADTLLMPWALRHAVARLLMSPEDTVAIAGCVLVQNSRTNVLTRMQEWDYFLGIASVKRQQALWQGTLVAQGAFSVYRRDALLRVGGWPDKIGEDIVVTWAMMRDGGRVGFEPTAAGFTEVPVRLAAFVRQRQRWARGMIEGLRDHGGALLGQRRLHTHAIGANLLFPYLDGVYTLAFLPGVALAFAGHFEIAGPMTLIVLPLNFAVSSVMLLRQRRVFDEVGLRIRRNRIGFGAYLLLYTPIVSPVAFSGYVKELTRRRRVW